LFPLFAPSVNTTIGKFSSGVVDTGGNLPPVSLTPVPPVSTGQGELVEKFATGVVETGGNLPLVSLIPAAICHWCH
jgi:hypothetical protein